jgi:peptidoglycan/LPS O-acetylase OafA/YrhL
LTNLVKYRTDIDGLRAIAVLSVVLYHFGIGPFHGGFIGVDIFFVISGFLITGIISKEIDAGDFTFLGFYERRARRIFPALFVMLLLVLAAGPWLLLPSDLGNLGKSTVATLLFCSNLLFWRQSGYFDTTSQFSPLLHTWSLAVEEQFYIFFPVLLLLVFRFARKALTPILIVSALLSFLLCVWQQPVRPGATFYLALFRAWEFLIGSLLAVGAVPAVRNRAWREGLALAALMVLLVALLRIEAGLEFPGWQAALPVLATAVLLHVGACGGSLVHRALSFRPMVFIGLISYSLYLWHWPLLVYLRYRGGMEPPSIGEGLALLAISVIAAGISYHWVETPFRRRGATLWPRSRRALFALVAGSMATLAVLAIGATADQGWRARMPADVVALDQARAPQIPYATCDGKAPDAAGAQCRAGDLRARHTVLLWGDSHALAWGPAFNLLGQKARVRVDLALASACAPLLGVTNPFNPACAQFNWDVLAHVQRDRPEQIYLVASWPAYSGPEGEYTLRDDQGRTGNEQVFAPALARTVAALRPYTRRIILIGRVPGAVGEFHFGGDVPFKLALAKWRGTPELPQKTVAASLGETKSYRDAAGIYAHDAQVTLLDPLPWFCDAAACRYRDDAGALLYRDTNHLSGAGAAYVAAHFPSGLLSARAGAEAR